nr:MAK10-like protein [Tanacetum cinerariifolium]
MKEENPICTLGDYFKPSHKGYRNTIELPVGNNVAPLRSDTIRLVQNECSFHELRFEDSNQHLKDFLKLEDSLDLDCENRERTIHHHMGGSYYSFPCLILSIGKDRKTPQRYPDVPTTLSRISIRSMDSKLRDRNAKESWALLKDLALYENESWNDPRDFAKPVKAITLPQDVLSISGHRLIELENQVQRLMEAHLAPTQPTQMNKITTSCEICSGPHDTQYCMEDLEQAFVEYPSSRTDRMGSSVEPSKTNYTNRENANETDEEVKSEKEVREEIEGETEEQEEDNLEHFDTFPTMKDLRKFLIENEEEIFTDAGDGVRIYPDDVASPAIGEGLILYQAYGNLYAMIGRKAHLLEDKKILSVGVFSTWMAFEGNTRDLCSFREETDEITNLHQDSPRSIAYKTWRRRRKHKARRRDLSGDGV